MLVSNHYFPPFSKQEYERRFRMFRDAMKEEGLDCLVIYGAHSYSGNDTGQVNAQYLSNYAGAGQTYVVLPLKDEPTLYITVPLHLPNAKDITSIEDVRSAGMETQIGVGERLKELGLEKGNIGIVGPTTSWLPITIPVEHYNYFIQTFPQANFQTVTEWYENSRIIKTEEEIKLMERAAALNDLAHESLVLATEAGVRHSHLRRIVEEVVLRFEGNYPMMHVSSFPMSNQQWIYPDYWPTHRTIEVGDMVMTENPVGYGIYYTKIWGVFFVGEPTKEYRDMFELAASVHDKAVRELRPGMTGRDAKKFMEPIKAAGYTTGMPLVLGWSNFNHAPTAGALDGSPGAFFQKPSDLDFVFKPGLCVSVVANPITPDFKKGLWVGTSCVFTQDGLRELNRYPASKLRVI